MIFLFNYEIRYFGQFISIIAPDYFFLKKLFDNEKKLIIIC